MAVMTEENSRQGGAGSAIRTETVCFWIAALFLFFYALGYRSLWGSEGRWAEVAREMILSGEWFHPAINGVPYFDKPLFSYWVIAIPSVLTGILNEFVARAPGAMAGLAALWATVSLGRLLFSERAAYVAGWLLLLSWGMLFWSRTACADIENVAFIMLAVLWYWNHRESPGFYSYLVFYIICFAGAHFKGLPAAVLPALICLPDLLRSRPWSRHITLAHLAALLIGVIFYLLPFLYAAITSDNYGQNGLYLVFRENILRFFNAFDHREPFYAYFYYVPMLFLPWIPLLSGAILHAVRHYGRADYRFRWLVEATLTVFLVYTLSDSRRSYYILPILPFCALMTGAFVADAGGVRRWKDRAFFMQFCILAAVAAVEFCAPFILPIVEKITGIVPPDGLGISFMATGGVALAFLIAAWRKQGHTGEVRHDIPIEGLIAAGLILFAGFFCWQQNVLEDYRYGKRFVLDARMELNGTGPENIGIGKDMASLFFYLGYDSPVKILDTPDKIKDFFAKGDVRYLVLQRRMLSQEFSFLPNDMKNSPFMEMPLYPGQKDRRKQLLMWKLQGPVDTGPVKGVGDSRP